MPRNENLKILITVFMILTIIKIFTAKVGLLGDPTIQLVVKPNLTISNSYIMKGEDNHINREKYKGTWYYEGKYSVITGDEAGFPGESLYDLLIICWWILIIGIPIYIIKESSNKKGI
ncbi:hypothetical protein [Clostridium cylindrosporum]|uniref:Uncharacterized protein n=1 Tax=Clostridium cylindrosporum DSM 605 TaxID=1121307 RepID=A0A0J8G222_CLOCY|nr:hypothetical protein [Clostridium cylindrosporum]KMT21806.1 hypothetical protein CLCY_3c00730 [Clostridium cylindrosporum DSM 605]